MLSSQVKSTLFTHWGDEVISGSVLKVGLSNHYLAVKAETVLKL